MTDCNAADKSSDGIRSLERGLNLLRAMNDDPHASVAALSRKIGVPRSTTYRLLSTLESLGYVGHLEATNTYHLTRQVRSLSTGFLDEDWLDAVWPELVALGTQLFWPVSLFTLDAGSMAVRMTTHERSPMSIDYGMTGRRMPLTETAAGRTYLAFCPAHERDVLLRLPDVEHVLATPADRELFERQLRKIVEDGYGARIGGVMPRTASISVPVMLGPRVFCCVSVIWIRSALTLEHAVSDLARPLKAASARIETIVSRSVHITAGR